MKHINSHVWGSAPFTFGDITTLLAQLSTSTKMPFLGVSKVKKKKVSDISALGVKLSFS